LNIVFYQIQRIVVVSSFQFPAGKSRLEPVGIVLFAGIMAMAAVQILQQSVSRILSGVTGVPSEVNLGTMSIILLCSVASIKLALFLFCRAVSKTGNFPSVEALAQDHLNDVTLDSVSLIAAGLLSLLVD
jgi:divalent metal cation (Fe/Co/Zn/Cd) transporter